MCYIHQGNVLKGTICSQYTDQAWHEDITHRNITLVFEIAESLAMRYLAFGISTNNYEWTVLHVQDRENNLPVNVMLPDGLSGSVKFGVKLYDAPPSAGSIINVGFDYVITGGVAMSDAGKTITMSCETDGATIRYTLDGSEPTETSLEYTGEFTVEPPVTIKARGYKDGMLAGEVAVKGITAKLPTPVIHQEYVSATENIIYFDNILDYPDEAIVERDYDGGWLQFITIGDLKNANPDYNIGNISSGSSLSIRISCENWETSDVTTIEYQSFKLPTPTVRGLSTAGDAGGTYQRATIANRNSYPEGTIVYVEEYASPPGMYMPVYNGDIRDDIYDAKIYVAKEYGIHAECEGYQDSDYFKKKANQRLVEQP